MKPEEEIARETPEQIWQRATKAIWNATGGMPAFCDVDRAYRESLNAALRDERLAARDALARGMRAGFAIAREHARGDWSESDCGDSYACVDWCAADAELEKLLAALAEPDAKASAPDPPCRKCGAEGLDPEATKGGWMFCQRCWRRTCGECENCGHSWEFAEPEPAAKMKAKPKTKAAPVRTCSRCGQRAGEPGASGVCTHLANMGRGPEQPHDFAEPPAKWEAAPTCAKPGQGGGG